jgi:transcription initiation factor TFIIA small subunit
MSAIYRGSKLGDCLVEALQKLIDEDKITGDLAQKVLDTFDQSMLHLLEKQVTAKGTLKGKLDVYRYLDNIWTFVMSDATLRSAQYLSVPKKDEEEVKVDGPVKMVLVDAKLAKVLSEEANTGNVEGNLP